MGNLASLNERLAEEFNRVKNLRKNPAKTDYLILQEVLMIQPQLISRENAIELSHVGTLFVLDENKEGKFHLSNFANFIKLCCDRYDSGLKSQSRGDFRTQFQGYCTWEMWNCVVREGGVDAFAEWFTLVLSEAEKINFFGSKRESKRKRSLILKETPAITSPTASCTTNPLSTPLPLSLPESPPQSIANLPVLTASNSSPVLLQGSASLPGTISVAPVTATAPLSSSLSGSTGGGGSGISIGSPAPNTPTSSASSSSSDDRPRFLSRGSIQTLHSVLNIKKSYGVSDRYFFDLMQQVAEDLSMMELKDRRYDDLVPLVLVKEFASDFISGFIKLMFDLGFETVEELEGRRNTQLRKHLFQQIGAIKRKSMVLSASTGS